MHLHRVVGLGALLATAVVPASGCGGSEALTGGAPESEAGVSAALQARREQAIGVDQHTFTHLFDALANGGRIGLQRGVDDPAAADRIRQHLRDMAEAFASGDFSRPAFVHMRQIPGMAAMAARKDQIEYVYRDLPRGGQIRLVTNDADALRAIHEFVAFLRERHRAGRMDHGARDHGVMHHDRAAMGRAHGGHRPGGDIP